MAKQNGEHSLNSIIDSYISRPVKGIKKLIGAAALGLTMAYGAHASQANNDVQNAINTQPVTINVIANDTGNNGNPAVVTAVAQPPAAIGQVAIVNNQVRFTPAAGGRTGPWSATYEIDGVATAQVSGQVYNPNVAPIATDQNFVIPQNGHLIVRPEAQGFVNDPDGGNIAIQLGGVQLPNGNYQTLLGNEVKIINGGSQIDIMNTTGIAGLDALVLQFNDDNDYGVPGNQGTAFATYTLDFQHQNEAPIAQPQNLVAGVGPIVVPALTKVVLEGDDIAFDGLENVSQAIVPLNIVLSATDAENDPTTFTVTQLPQNGVLSGTAPNLVYTQTPGFSGEDSFSFIANDGQANSLETRISLTVPQLNELSLQGVNPQNPVIVQDGDDIAVNYVDGAQDFSFNRVITDGVNTQSGLVTIDYQIRDPSEFIPTPTEGGLGPNPTDGGLTNVGGVQLTKTTDKKVTVRAHGELAFDAQKAKMKQLAAFRKKVKGEDMNKATQQRIAFDAGNLPYMTMSSDGKFELMPEVQNGQLRYGVQVNLIPQQTYARLSTRDLSIGDFQREAPSTIKQAKFALLRADKTTAQSKIVLNRDKTSPFSYKTVMNVSVDGQNSPTGYATSITNTTRIKKPIVLERAYPNGDGRYVVAKLTGSYVNRLGNDFTAVKGDELANIVMSAFAGYDGQPISIQNKVVVERAELTGQPAKADTSVDVLAAGMSKIKTFKYKTWPQVAGYGTVTEGMLPGYGKTSVSALSNLDYQIKPIEGTTNYEITIGYRVPANLILKDGKPAAALLGGTEKHTIGYNSNE